LAHEIGHTLGLAHDGGSMGGIAGFMQDGTSLAPTLDWDAPSDVAGMDQGEVWRDLVPSKFYPRANGFQMTPCSGPSDCDTYPGLICSGGQCL